MTPAIPGTEAEDFRSFLEVGGDGHGASDDVEEDVPLRAKKHQQHGGYLQPAAEAQQKEKNNRKEGGGGNGGSHLHQWLCDTGQARIRSNGDAGWNGPQSAED